MNYTLISVSENILLAKEGFGKYDEEAICDLLRHVAMWMSDAVGTPRFSGKKIVVLPHDEYPMCSNVGPFRIISLATRENYWCQWVYQFAHEYCHHLINGPMNGELCGLIWFEETICELSSMFCLSRMVDYCTQHTNPYLTRYRPSVQKYLYALLRGEQDEVPLPLYIQRNLPLLTQPVYQREIYRQIAGQILPLYLECPSLWRMILHFGNMREWQSLTHLFDHLREEADATYAESLEGLRSLLIG